MDVGHSEGWSIRSSLSFENDVHSEQKNVRTIKVLAFFLMIGYNSFKDTTFQTWLDIFISFSRYKLTNITKHRKRSRCRRQHYTCRQVPWDCQSGLSMYKHDVTSLTFLVHSNIFVSNKQNRYIFTYSNFLSTIAKPRTLCLLYTVRFPYFLFKVFLGFVFFLVCDHFSTRRLDVSLIGSPCPSQTSASDSHNPCDSCWCPDPIFSTVTELLLWQDSPVVNNRKNVKQIKYQAQRQEA